MCSPSPMTTTETVVPCLYWHNRYCLRPQARSRLPYDKLTGLIGFTLSHFGSHTPLPTLKSDLAASTPRLSTDCRLCFVGSGLPPLYAINAFWRSPEFCTSLIFQKGRLIRGKKSRKFWGQHGRNSRGARFWVQCPHGTLCESGTLRHQSIDTLKSASNSLAPGNTESSVSRTEFSVELRSSSLR